MNGGGLRVCSDKQACKLVPSAPVSLGLVIPKKSLAIWKWLLID